MTDDRTPFGTALDDRVRDEHPDVDELIRVSASRGTRIRRRRRAVASLAIVAGAAAVALTGSQLTGPGGATGRDPGFVAEPTASPTTPQESPTTPVPPPGATVVFVDAPGWQCSEPADEKFICSQGKGSVIVNWRPGDERSFYLDPDKADVLTDVHTYVSDVHGQWFATVAPVPGTTQAQVDEVGAALVWVS